MLGKGDIRLGRTETAPGSGDSSCVGQHAQAAVDLGQVTARDTGGRLAANTELESGRAPIHDPNRLPGLDGSNSCLDVLGNNVTAIKQTTGHCKVTELRRLGQQEVERKRTDCIFLL